MASIDSLPPELLRLVFDQVYLKSSSSIAICCRVSLSWTDICLELLYRDIKLHATDQITSFVASKTFSRYRTRSLKISPKGQRYLNWSDDLSYVVAACQDLEKLELGKHLYQVPINVLAQLSLPSSFLSKTSTHIVAYSLFNILDLKSLALHCTFDNRLFDWAPLLSTPLRPHTLITSLHRDAHPLLQFIVWRLTQSPGQALVDLHILSGGYSQQLPLLHPIASTIEVLRIPALDESREAMMKPSSMLSTYCRFLTLTKSLRHLIISNDHFSNSSTFPIAIERLVHTTSSHLESLELLCTPDIISGDTVRVLTENLSSCERLQLLKLKGVSREELLKVSGAHSLLLALEKTGVTVNFFN